MANRRKKDKEKVEEETTESLSDTFIFPDGTKYVGNYIASSTGTVYREGNGTCIFSDGSRYEGEWKGDEMKGHGKLFCSNGDQYEGEFAANAFHGQGKYRTKEGKVLEGSWKANRLVKQVSYTDTQGIVWLGHIDNTEESTGSGVLQPQLVT